MKFFGDSMGRPIYIVALALCSMGLIALLSASCTTGAVDPKCGYNSLYFAMRQGICCALGWGMLLCVWRFVDLDKTRRWMSGPAMVVGLLMSIAMFFFPEQNGAHRWITLGPINIQVGELCKVVFICCWADVLSRNYSQLGKGKEQVSQELPWYQRFIQCLCREIKIFRGPALLSFLILFFIFVGHDLGMVTVLSVIVLAMICLSGFPFALVCELAGLAGVLGVGMACSSAYRRARLVAWLHPEQYAHDAGYQVMNSFYAISGGGLWGRGLTASGQKYGFLPEQHTDFIYSIICEEIGYVGSMGFLVLFVALCVCGFILTWQCKDPYRKLLAFGISFQIFIQALINMEVVNGSFPNKGLPLPFVSYGGSSMLVTLIEIGILLNVSGTFRNTGIKQRKKAAPVPRKVRCAHSISNSRVPYPSSSSEVLTSPVSSGEWNRIVGSDACNHRRTLPKPRVNEGWRNRVIAIDRSMRERREWLRAQRKLL